MRGKEMFSLLLLAISALLTGYILYETYKGAAVKPDAQLAARVADLEVNLRALDDSLEKVRFLLEDVANAPKEQVLRIEGPVELEVKKEKVVAAKAQLSKEELDFVRKAHAQRKAKAILKESAKKIKELSK